MPGGRLKVAIDARQRPDDALGRVREVIAVATLVANEVPLRLRVGARTQPIDDVLVGIDVNAATGAASRADTVGGFQIPDALLVKEILATERADRAEIDDIAREFVF